MYSASLCVYLLRTLYRRQSLDGFPSLLLGETEFIETLQVEPEFGSCAEEVGEAQGCVASDGAPSVQDLSHAIGGNI